MPRDGRRRRVVSRAGAPPDRPRLTGLPYRGVAMQVQRFDMIDEYEKVKHLDVAAVRVVSQPTATIAFNTNTDFEGEDIGGYKFGTPFALNVGAGVRFVPGGRFQLRVDVADHLYQIRYPSSYYQSSSPTVDPVLPARQKQNIWKHNAALTIGVSYLLGR